MRALDRRVLALVSMALPVCVARPASAGELRGDVLLGRTVDSRTAADVVVWLDRVPERVERRLTGRGWQWFWSPPPPSQPARLVAKGHQYRPRVLAIAAGTRLEIRNEDVVWHGPFSVSPARGFDLGKRPPGSVDTLAFDSTGVVAVRCDIHPDMAAFVVVTPNHAFTRADAAGHWRLPDLPAGSYEVRAWHPRLGQIRRQVTVPARGTTSLLLRW